MARVKLQESLNPPLRPTEYAENALEIAKVDPRAPISVAEVETYISPILQILDAMNRVTRPIDK